MGAATDGKIRGFRSNDILYGLSGSDEIQGKRRSEILNGADENYHLCSCDGNPVLDGGIDNDDIHAEMV